MSIKFIVKINKLGIYYFYLSNLALEGKEFWVRKKYNEKFFSVAGPLNSKEKKDINLFGHIIYSLKQKRSPISLLSVFFDKNPWEKLASSVEVSEYKIIEKTFNAFNKKWQVFWQKELVSESVLGKKYLEKNIRNKRCFINKTLQNLSVFYNKTNLPSDIKIFLIPLAADIQEGGGKYISMLNSIILESSSKRIKEKGLVEIMLHETVHLCFENAKFFKIINKVENKIPKYQQEKLIKPLGIPSVEFGIKELIATSLTMKKIQRNGVGLNYQNFLVYVSERLQSSIDYYLKNKKVFDEKLIKEFLKTWKLYLKK